MGLDSSAGVTLGVFGLCVGLYAGLLPVPLWIQTIQDVCLLPRAMLRSPAAPVAFFVRATAAHLFHLHDMHLYYNMTSWLWKGRQLERQLGSISFSVLVVLLGLASSCIYVAFAYILSLIGHGEYMDHCAVGLSCVLFALKVILFHNSATTSSVLDLFQVPSRYVYWVELVVIQLIDPSASWIGHAAGIVAGLMYVRGPLQHLVRTIAAGIGGVSGSIHRSRMEQMNDDVFGGERDALERPQGDMLTNAERDRVRQAHLTRMNSVYSRRRV